MFYKILVFCIFLANGVLPATAKFGLPKPRFHPKDTRPISNYFHKTPNHDLEFDPLRSSEDYEDSYPYRRDQNIYIIALPANSPLLKTLQNLPLQKKREDSFELPAKKTLAMLPLINFDNSNENDVNRAKSDSISDWGKLVDKDGVFYITGPKDSKNILRSNMNSPQWNEINNVLNRGLIEKRKEPAPEPEIYRFSDLVL